MIYAFKTRLKLHPIKLVIVIIKSMINKKNLQIQ